MMNRPTPLFLAVLIMVVLASVGFGQQEEFNKAGVAFLEKHCILCHGEKTKRADLTLQAFKDDAAVIKNRKVFANVLRMVGSGEMPPATKPKPTVTEIETFTRAVNAVFDKHDRTAKLDPGHVTIRRLNRAEYNNTIRDLVGVDFQPAEDFPADDVGHGFDNIADVLSLSPVLMERYLAAAESIVNRAIVVDPVKPPIRALASRWLEPSQQENIRWRPLVKGTLHTQYRPTTDGEFVFRVRAYASPPDGEPVKIALVAAGKEIKTFEVSATEKKPEIYEVPLTLPAGDIRVGVTLLNPLTRSRNAACSWSGSS